MSEDNSDTFSLGTFWDHPQFLTSDVCRITGATPKALEHFVNPKRDLVRLVGAHANPGSGRRRVFTAAQVLMIAAAYTMTRINFPQRWVRTLADSVERRARFRMLPSDMQTGVKMVTYPMSHGDDWTVSYLFDEREDEPEMPTAYHMLDVDRLIDQVEAQLKAIVDDKEVPDFSISDPEPEPNPYGPASNFFRMWEKAESGRWKYVGLSCEETDEFLELQGIKIVGDDLEYTEKKRGRSGRFTELHNKHERERLKLCAMNMENKTDGE